MNLPAPLKSWTLPLLLALVCTTIQLLNWGDMLRYERELLATQPWRLLTGHLVHLGWNHLLLNLAALTLTWALFGQRINGAHWAVALIGCALFISIALFLRDAEVSWYVGLSGVLHGLLVLGALASMRCDRRTALLLLLGVTIKLTWEQVSGSDTGTHALIGGTVVVNAHLYGAVAGLLCAPLLSGAGVVAEGAKQR